MASVVAEIATSFVIFVCVVQGIRSLEIQHEPSLNATVGQNISLPCIITEDSVHITQLEWHREGKLGDKKLVVFNPQFSQSFFEEVKLQLVKRTNTSTLQGSILLLYEVTEKDNGDYICEISSFPHGSSRKTTRVTVTVPWITARVESPNASLVEGDEVKILCASHPPADLYTVSALQSKFSLESQTGHFTIQNVTRRHSDLICRPLWTSSNQHLQSLSAAVQLTVDYLDSIECSSSSYVEVETGTNLTVTCEAKSSESLHYIWSKGNVTICHRATMNLWSVNPAQSGTYSLTVQARNQSRLHRRRDFEVSVVSRTYTERQSTTFTMETTSPMTEGRTTAEPDNSTTTSQPVYTDTTTPSAGNITTSHANFTAAHRRTESSSSTSPGNASTEGSTVSAGCCQNDTSSTESTREGSTPPDYPTSTTIFKPRTTIFKPSTTVFKPSTTVFKPRTTIFKPRTTVFKLNQTAENILTTSVTSVRDQSGSKSHVVYVLIPIFLLLGLIGFLYRRYLLQKRMDMPPPFKPPPPPVKYTSVRSQDIPVTDV